MLSTSSATFRRIVGIAAIALATALLSPIAASQAAEPSYLFTVDSPLVKVKPGKAEFARIVVKSPRTTQFTDRPEREAGSIGTKIMLEAFGWDEESRRLRHYPNAAVSIDGMSQVVEVRRATKAPGRLVLWVRGLEGPLDKMTGPGSIFVDNAPAGYATQTLLLPPTQAPYVLFGLAGPRDGVAITLVENAVLSPDGTWSGGTTVQIISVSPESPTAQLTWTNMQGQMEFDIEFALERVPDGLLISMNGSQTLEGGAIPIDTGTVVPSYWCAAAGEPC